MRVEWRDIALPDFGMTAEPPVIPQAVYEARCRRAYAGAAADRLAVYGAVARSGGGLT